MKRITCEMCGSTDLMKDGGVFVCQSCGTKYSVEEAKKMMIEGTVDVSGSTVKMDNSGSIANYLVIAQNAYDADNKREAESYCNKIIEIDPENHEAWLLKGKAAGWQSTVAKLRFDEAVNCFTKAVEYAPKENMEIVKDDVAEEITSLTSALIHLCCDNFASLPTKDNADSVVRAVRLMERIGITLLLKCGAKTTDLSKLLAVTISNSAMDAWKNIVWPSYGGANNHPSRYVWQRFVEQGDAVITMLKTAISICDNDNSADAIRYSNMIAIETKICDSASYKYDPTFQWIIEYQLNATAKTRRNQMIMEWHIAWNKINSSHVIPSAKAISKATNDTANRQASSNRLAVLVAITIVIVVFIIALLDVL